MRNVFLLFVLTFFISQAFGQIGDIPPSQYFSGLSGFSSPDIKQSNGQPNVPGALVLDFANNILLDAPDSMGLNFLGSWTVNIYYQYEFQIGQSNLSFHPGLGVGLEKYNFNKDVTLATSPDDVLTLITPAVNVVPNGSKILKTTFAANYFDFPIEFRFYAKKSKKGFNLAAGGKIGVRFDSGTKIKYEEKGQTKKLKDKQNFNLNSPRFGVYGRLGTGGFSLYYYYGITEMFKTNQSPNLAPVRTMMIGISLKGL